MSVSTDVINLLTDYGFRREEKAADHYLRMSQERRDRLLDEVASIYAEQQDAIVADCRASEEEFATYPEQGPLNRLGAEKVKQFALYADQLVIDDPLVDCHPDLQSPLTVEVEAGKRERDERAVIEAIKTLVEIRDLVRDGHVKLFPKALFSDKTAPVYYRELGNNLKTPEMAEYARDRMDVTRLIVNPDRSMQITGEAANQPTRSIAVAFKDAGVNAVADMWFWVPAEPGVNLSQENGSLRMTPQISADDLRKPMDADAFLPWVSDCRERSVLGRIKDGFDHIALAEAFGSHFVAQSPATWVLMRMEHENTRLRSDQAQISSVMSELNLPFLTRVEGSEIAALRRNEEAFENFRRAMRDFARSVTALPGTPDFSKQVRELQADKVDAELAKLNQQACRVVEKLGVNALLMGATLTTAAVTGQFAWLPALLTVLPNFVTLSQDREQISKNSLFFLWSLSRGR